jgi:hypothetical protein
MTPQEKAKELVLKFKELSQEGSLIFYLTFEISKQCALIAVDEIIASMPKEPMISTLARVHVIMFWVEVKQEIEKL